MSAASEVSEYLWRRTGGAAGGIGGRSTKPHGSESSRDLRQGQIGAPRFQSSETGVHDLSGLNRIMSLNAWSVAGPRSFSKTTPSWLTIKVLIPVTPYWAGAATRAKPPIMTPLTTKSISPRGAADPCPFKILK